MKGIGTARLKKQKEYAHQVFCKFINLYCFNMDVKHKMNAR